MPECDGQTDRRTDRQTDGHCSSGYIPAVCIACYANALVKTGNISETVEYNAKVTINGLYKVVHGLSIAVKMYDLE